MHLLLLLVSLRLGPVAPVPSAEDDLAAKSRRGKELMAASRFSEAAAVYRELVKAAPDNAGLLLNLGLALHLSGHDGEAIPHLEAALRRQPDLLPAALFLGASNLRLGRAAAAAAALEKAVRLQPDNRDARSLLVDALLALDRPVDAEPHLRRLAETSPRDPAGWFNLGTVYEGLSAQTFEDMLKQDPESPFALALAAEARLRQNQRIAAFHLYRQAIERGPTVRGLHSAVGDIYRATGHPDWAAVEEEKERGLPRADCARDVLECAFSAGKYREVVAAPAAVRSPEASYWRARAYGELAEQAFGRLAALPASPQSHERKAVAHRDGRRYAESAEEWRQALAKAPDDPRLRMELAVTLRLDQDLAGAQRILEDLVRAAPDAPQGNYLLGDVLLAQQQPERALPFLEKAVRIAPEEPHARGALGRTYALLGRPADALPHLERALVVDVDGSLRLQLARAYQAAGQAKRAEAALEDYEQFRKASRAGAESEETQAAITPPDGVAR